MNLNEIKEIIIEILKISEVIFKLFRIHKFFIFTCL